MHSSVHHWFHGEDEENIRLFALYHNDQLNAKKLMAKVLAMKPPHVVMNWLLFLKINMHKQNKDIFLLILYAPLSKVERNELFHYAESEGFDKVIEHMIHDTRN